MLRLCNPCSCTVGTSVSSCRTSIAAALVGGPIKLSPSFRAAPLDRGITQFFRPNPIVAIAVADTVEGQLVYPVTASKKHPARTMYHRSRLVFLLVALASTAAAHDDHGGHGQKPIVDEHANWMTRHMAGM